MDNETKSGVKQSQNRKRPSKHRQSRVASETAPLVQNSQHTPAQNPNSNSRPGPAQSKSKSKSLGQLQGQSPGQSPSPSPSPSQRQVQPQGQSQSQPQGQGQGHFQGQNQGQGQGQCTINPCKCCCKGNLRQGGFAVAIFEIFFCIISIPFLIVNIVGASFIDEIQNKVNEGLAEHGATQNMSWDFNEEFMLISGTGAHISMGIGLLLLVIAAVIMFVAVCGRSKVGSIVHSAVAVILALFHCIQIGFAACALGLAGERDEKCRKHFDPSQYPDAAKIPDYGGRNPCDLYIITKVECGLQIAWSIFLVLFAVYFAIISAGLYTQYRAGNKYEGTPLCCCGRGNQNQGYQQEDNQNPSAYQQAPPAYH